MIDRISQEFQFHQRALSIREQRQEVLASNIANADTPGYKARDTNFRAMLQQAVVAQDSPRTLALRRTAPQHLRSADGGAALEPALLYRRPTQARLDGNTVDMDVERVQFMDNSLRYQAELTFLSGRVKAVMAALQQ